MSGCGLAANELLSERLATAHGQLAWGLTRGGAMSPARQRGGRRALSAEGVGGHPARVEQVARFYRVAARPTLCSAVLSVVCWL